MARRKRKKDRADEGWWKARGRSLGPGNGGFQQGHLPRLEDYDREGSWRAFSLDWSEGLLTMDWRRGS